jgi:hypothetical protein
MGLCALGKGNILRTMDSLSKPLLVWQEGGCLYHILWFIVQAKPNRSGGRALRDPEDRENSKFRSTKSGPISASARAFLFHAFALSCFRSFVFS